MIWSTVHSNTSGSIGFLRCEESFNVAATRAKVGFNVVGNAWTLVNGDDYGQWSGFLEWGSCSEFFVQV